jgi:hypothetical protein
MMPAAPSLSVILGILTRAASYGWHEQGALACAPEGPKDNSPGRGSREQVFVRGVEGKRSAVLGGRFERAGLYPCAAARS